MISATVVLYNTRIEDIENIIKSYSPNEDRYLIFVDNSKEMNEYCQKIKNKYIDYIFNEQNIGYGAAHNIGIKKAIDLSTDYHIVLNPDIRFKTYILEELVKYAEEHEDVGYILPKVVYPNGEMQYLCKLLPTPFDLIFRRFLPQFGAIKKMNQIYTLRNFDYHTIINSPCLSGCFMFMRTKMLKEYNLFFDERFFMYCEDFDLIRRIHRVAKTIYYPYVTIVHSHEKASYKNKKMLFLHIKSACLYFNKYGWFRDCERRTFNLRCKRDIKCKK